MVYTLNVSAELESLVLMMSTQLVKLRQVQADCDSKEVTTPF
jgi:hypothetical protein